MEKMDFIAAVVEDPSFQFSLPEPDVCAPPFLQIHDVTFGYNANRVLFRDVNIGIDNDSRIALVGHNGSGKSTFLNVICGDLEPMEGRVIRNGKCRIARFTQHHVGQLKMQQTPLEFMKSQFPSCEEGELRGQLSRFGLSGEKALQPIYTLSGGQKSRVAFAQMTFCKPHLLLLDEPTNHLDIDTVDALIEALNMYSGGVLIISHDEHLISQVCDEIWVAGGGNLKRFDGNFADYKKQLVKEMTKK
jgi:ATP-binding cassette subfamily F protein 3